jgi:hypothetical protein
LLNPEITYKYPKPMGIIAETINHTSEPMGTIAETINHTSEPIDTIAETQVTHEYLNPWVS